MKGFALIARYVLIVALVIGIIALTFIQVASSTVLKKEYAKAELEKTNYYHNIYEEIMSNFENYVGQSGLDDAVMQEVLSEDKVKEDVNIMVDNIYVGMDKKIDVTDLRNKLNEKIEKVMSDNGIKATNQSSVDTFVDKICEEYTNTMTHFEQYENEIFNVYNKVLPYIRTANKALIVMIFVIVLLILAICYKRIYKTFTSVGVSLVSSGVFFSIVNCFINWKVRVDTITILNEPISNLARDVIKDVLMRVSIAGYVMLGVGICLIIFGNLLDSNRKRKK